MEVVDLLVVQLKSAIRRLLDAKGVRARVVDKVNRFGEVVIGVILEKTPRDTASVERAADALEQEARDPNLKLKS